MNWKNSGKVKRRHHMSDHLPESFSLASSWLNKACTTWKASESEWLAKDNPKTSPIPIKPKTASHMAEQFSWVPLPYCSLPGCPFPIKSLTLSAHVSPQTIHFWVLDKSPISGPGRGPPSCNIATHTSDGLAIYLILIISQFTWIQNSFRSIFFLYLELFDLYVFPFL